MKQLPLDQPGAWACSETRSLVSSESIAVNSLQRGWRQHQAGRFSRAERLYRSVLADYPADATAWCYLGMVCHDQRLHSEAVEAYRQALEHRPEFPVALSNLGNTLIAQGRYEEAVACCRQALAFNPAYRMALNNLAAAQMAAGDLAGAEYSLEASLTQAPGDAEVHANLAALLVRQGRLERGGEQARLALKSDPGHASAHLNLAMLALMRGDFAQGWPLYEWRWRRRDSPLPRLSGPRWTGDDLRGRRLLLVAEQGLGDTLHFIRYAALLRQRGTTVLAAVQRPLLPLLRACEGVDEWLPLGGDYAQYDVWTPLLSVPGLLNTTLETIPQRASYLAADPGLVEFWTRRMAAFQGFKIGIAWQGSTSFDADRQRSASLREFAPLAKLPGIKLFSLQKGYGHEQCQQLDGSWSVVDFGEELDGAAGPFMDTAAIISSLDLVVTVDTAVAHLAGALGVPVWLALSASPDWRWLLEREDTPWYPGMRLFRQDTLGEWAPVFRTITAQVAQLAIDKESPSGLSSEVCTIMAPLSPGELLDKISILEIKWARIADEAKRANVGVELDALRAAQVTVVVSESEQLRALCDQLKRVNEQLWDIEDHIRLCEREQKFGTEFIVLARSVYQINDRRAAIKLSINGLLGSPLIEEKCHPDYGAGEADRRGVEPPTCSGLGRVPKRGKGRELPSE